MILVTNDDGIFAPGMWALARALLELDQVVIVAPDRERSAIGTAMTLRRPLRMRQAHSIVDGIRAFAIDGTPGDSVILAISKLFETQIDLVVSGINEGFNTGDDILISGTVGAALQGYLHGQPALAVSTSITDRGNLDIAAHLAKLVAQGIKCGELSGEVFLNINVPEKPLAEIHGVALTRPAHKSHLDVAEEGSDGRQPYYWLRRRCGTTDPPKDTDIKAIDSGLISITPLHTTLFGCPARMDDIFCQGLFTKLKALPAH